MNKGAMPRLPGSCAQLVAAERTLHAPRTHFAGVGVCARALSRACLMMSSSQVLMLRRRRARRMAPAHGWAARLGGAEEGGSLFRVKRTHELMNS